MDKTFKDPNVKRKTVWRFRVYWRRGYLAFFWLADYKGLWNPGEKRPTTERLVFEFGRK